MKIPPTLTKTFAIFIFLTGVIGLVAYKSGAFEIVPESHSFNDNLLASIDSPEVKIDTLKEEEIFIMRGSKSAEVLEERLIPMEELKIKAEEEARKQDSIEKAKRLRLIDEERQFRMMGSSKSAMVIDRNHPMWYQWDARIKEDSIRKVHKALLDSAIR